MGFSSKHEHTLYFRIFSFLATAWLLGLVGCAGVKNPPKNIPYVYNNDVVIRTDELNAEQRGLLKEKLLLYLDDSLQVQTISVLGRTRRINPPVFDSANINRSIRFMNGYLNSVGYYNASFDSFTVKKDVKPEKNEIRISNTFFVTLGKSLKVDTLIYRFKHAALQHLADSVKSKSSLLPGTFYSKEKVAAELDRLAAVFRQQGHMRITRSSLLVEADTTDLLMIDPAAHPVEQVISAVKRKEYPFISLTVMQRPGVDSSIFLAYYIDSVIIYPESRISEEMTQLMQDSTLQTFEFGKRFLMKDRDNLFTKKLISKNNYLLPGTRYNETNYFKTLNQFSQMGPWEQVDGRTLTRMDSLPLASLHLFLYPAKKQTFQVDLEGSQNNNISVSNALAGRFLAIALNTSHRNRNVFRSGIQSTTTATVGFELNNTRTSASPNFFQTFLMYLSQSYTLPKLIKPFNFLNQRGNIDVGRTNINVSALYTERFKFFQQTSVNTNLQWEWRKGRNTTTFTLPNFETVFLQQYQDSLDKVIEQNPSLRYAFTPGNILSSRVAVERAVKYKKPNHIGFYRLSGELALPPGFKLFNNEFFSFFLLQGQYVEGIKLRNSSLHYRFYSGVGWDISSTKGGTLPFFRQFVAGGNNSMRAWVLRQLGLGNSIVSDTASFTDRFGDIQLEANLEHRFRLFRFFGYDLQGATFVDAGNIWNHKNNADDKGKFELKNLYRDLAMNVGLGIRWDLSYLVVRLDAAYKVKDPVREGDGWMKTFEWRGTNRLGTNERSNVGVQFGIGYPF
jgi:outer membrane protein insertion porin family